MDSQKQDKQNEGNAQNDSDYTSPIKGGQDVHSHKNSTTSEQNEQAEIKNKSIIEKYKSMNTTDTIAFYQLIATIVGGVIGIGLFAFTILAFMEAMRANTISQKANAISENNYRLAKESYESSAKESKDRFELDKANAQAQINAMTEQVRIMKEQFEITNNPFLSIENPRPINFSMNEPISINYEIVNLGNYPVKIIRAIVGGTFNGNIKKINNHLDEIDFEDDISYITKIPKVKTLKISHDKSDIHYFENKLPYYIFGKIIYINPANNTKRQLRFIIRLAHPEIPLGGFDYVQIDNTDL